MSASAGGPPPTRAPGRSRKRRPARIALSVVYIVALCLFGLDQVTKRIVVATLAHGQEAQVLGPILSFTHRQNSGGAFGLFSSGAVILTAIAAAVVIALLFFCTWAAVASRPLGVGLALQLGGAAGNLLDRLRLGHVTDFIDVHVWPVFNIADIGITVGAGLMVWALLADPALRSLPKSRPSGETPTGAAGSETSPPCDRS